MTNRRPTIIIGIDPDVEKSGVARLVNNELELSSLSFPQLIEYLTLMRDICLKTGEKAVVVVEASWLISTNWHTGRYDNIRTAARKGHRKVSRGGKKDCRVCAVFRP